MLLYQHSNGAHVGQLSLDQAMKWNIRFQILCQNQEEKDLLDAYQLMYGREVEVDIFEAWKVKRNLSRVRDHYDHSAKVLRLLPVVFTTFRTHGSQLRGL